MRLERAVSGLPQTLRSVIELRQVDGRSLKEIARSIGISVPAAKSRLSRAKAKLRRSMQ
jgi:RNA polymerase sigma-70 factor (ECF subfamily)